MDSKIPDRYHPLYPEDHGAPEAEIQSFITNFYRVSDIAEENEQWINSFTEDAHVQIGDDEAKGSEEIRELRRQMWSTVTERKHKVFKVFPGQLKGPKSGSRGEAEKECMMLGEASFVTRDGRTLEMAWSGHAVLKKDGQNWKFSKYRVWVQGD